MNWESAAAIAELLGAIGVIVSLLYVAKEVRSNTKAMKASAGFEASAQMSSLNESLALAVLGDPEYQRGGESRFTRMSAKVYDPEATMDDLSPTEQLVVGFIDRGLLQRIEGEYYLYQHGFLDPAQWEARRSWTTSFLSLPVNSTFLFYVKKKRPDILWVCLRCQVDKVTFIKRLTSSGQSLVIKVRKFYLL